MGCHFCHEHRFTKDHHVTNIEKNRGCTDIIFLLFWLFSWIAVVAIVIEANAQGGDPNKIIRGVDIQGRICGKSAGVEDKPYAAWPYPPAFRQKICVSSCNYTQSPDSDQMGWLYPSKKFLHFCIPMPVQLQGSVSVKVELSGDFDALAQSISRTIGDLFTVYPLYFQGFGIAVVIVFVWAFLIRFIASFLVWVTVCVIIAFGFVLSLGMLEYSKTMDTEVSPGRAKFVETVGYILLAGTIIFCLMIIALKQRIHIAIEVVKEASRAIGEVKAVVFFPIVPILMTILYFVFWVAGALYIFSVSSLTAKPAHPGVLQYGDPAGIGYWGPLEFAPNANYANLNCTSVNDCQYQKFEFDQNFQKLGAFHFFHLLWSIQFFFYFGYFVTAGTIAYWYFTPRDSSGHHKINHTPVLHSVGRTCRYHLGTIAFGSFIIAVVQFIRYLILYIESQTKDKENNELQKIVFCIIHCFLKCVECCLDKINKHAFIWTSIWGDSFLVAACSSFALIWRNLARVAALNMVAHFLFALGKVMIALTVSGIIGSIIMNVEPYKSEVYSPVLPIFIMFLIAYVTASLFMLIFASAVDTIFICFLVDEEKNGDTAEGMMAPESLQKLVGKYHQHSKKVAHGHKMRRPGHASAHRKQMAKDAGDKGIPIELHEYHHLYGEPE